MYVARMRVRFACSCIASVWIINVFVGVISYNIVQIICGLLGIVLTCALYSWHPVAGHCMCAGGLVIAMVLGLYSYALIVNVGIGVNTSYETGFISGIMCFGLHAWMGLEVLNASEELERVDVPI